MKEGFNYIDALNWRHTEKNRKNADQKTRIQKYINELQDTLKYLWKQFGEFVIDEPEWFRYHFITVISKNGKRISKTHDSVLKSLDLSEKIILVDTKEDSDAIIKVIKDFLKQKGVPVNAFNDKTYFCPLLLDVNNVSQITYTDIYIRYINPDLLRHTS